MAKEKAKPSIIEKLQENETRLHKKLANHFNTLLPLDKVIIQMLHQHGHTLNGLRERIVRFVVHVLLTKVKIDVVSKKPKFVQDYDYLDDIVPTLTFDKFDYAAATLMKLFENTKLTNSQKVKAYLKVLSKNKIRLPSPHGLEVRLHNLIDLGWISKRHQKIRKASVVYFLQPELHNLLPLKKEPPI